MSPQRPAFPWRARYHDARAVASSKVCRADASAFAKFSRSYFVTLNVHLFLLDLLTPPALA